MFATVPTEPASVVSTIVPLPAVRSLSFASLRRSVTAVVDVPFAISEPAAVVITECAAFAAPGTNATEVGVPIDVPPSVPVIDAVPAEEAEVSVAV